MSFFPFPFLSFLLLSHLSLKAPNQQENFKFSENIFSSWRCWFWEQRRKFFHSLPIFHCPCAFFFLPMHLYSGDENG